MTNNIKYIIREVPAKYSDFSFYFDDDGLTETGGDYCNNLFIISYDGYRVDGFNMDEYKRVKDKAENIAEDFYNIENGYNCYFTSYKEAMEYNGIPYNSYKCHKLKEWARNADIDDVGCIADFLTIITGKEWTTDSVHGYCQGDYVEMVYCPEHYKNGVKPYGEIWLGCGKEFCLITLENGEEKDKVYGYIVADCQVIHDEDYKKLICEWACIPEEETQLEVITDYKYKADYSYSVVL